MKLIPRIAVLAAGVLLPLTACGAQADQPQGTPNPQAVDHVAVWQAYYDATHYVRPRPAVDHVAVWQAYYDATHYVRPRPAVDHVAAWQAYYDATDV